MGRKRNQGKARRAAKAKAKEEVAKRGGNNNPTANSSEEADERDNNQATTLLLLSAQMRQLQVREECMHGCDHPFASQDDSPSPLQCASAFHCSFHETFTNDRLFMRSWLTCAFRNNKAEFVAVWRDPAKMEMAISCFLCMGTQGILEGNHKHARKCATVVRYLEQEVEVVMKHTRAQPNWIKVDETFYSDDHTLIKFFRHRIPCSCLDKKYEEVKDVPKMGHCYNPQCSIPGRRVERSETKYCSRCRNVTYCSRKCQEVHWTEHMYICDEFAATERQE